MDSAIDMERARELVADTSLWPLVRAFLWDFAPQVDKTRAGEVLEGVPAGLAREPRVKAIMLDRLGVTPCFHDFPKEDWSRLALFDGAMLHSLVKWLGTVACADSLRSVTSGAEVRALKSALKGVYPDVFGYVMYFGRLALAVPQPPEGMDRACFVQGLGCRILFSLMSKTPENVLSRVRLKLPKAVVDAAGAEPLAGFEAGADALKFVPKLLKLKFPEAYRLCC